ncbi:GNAT family N-acetyltransferase [Lachnoclostridium sp. An298]|nr:GNAT family N-acetyltransferase [Lachnoclostridium sp. An298]
MNTPRLETDRLILRKFTEDDLEALYYMHSDEEVNRFLPWFPLRNMEDAKAFYEERFVSRYREERAYGYAVCLKENDYLVGYVNVSMDDSYDFGYGLRRKFWHRGIITEAGKAVIEQLWKDGIPYITATHDVNNPRSGSVMKRLGMKYRYSYQEQWQPKNIQVIFRMYQLNLDGNENRIYQRYWDNSEVHFIERDV